MPAARHPPTPPGPGTHFLPTDRTPPDVLLDRAARLQGTALFSALLEAMPGPAMALDQNRQVVAANRRLRRTYGWPTLEAVLGERPGDLLGCVSPAESPAGCGTGRRCRHCGLVRTILAGADAEHPVVGECRIQRCDGDTLELEVTATRIAVDEDPLFLVGLRDVGDAKRRELLERTFLHDLLNTAGNLRGVLDVMGGADPVEEDRLRRMTQDLADALLGEIHGHRRLCEAEAGQLRLAARRFNLRAMLAAVCAAQAARPAAWAREVVLEDGPPLDLLTDPILVRRVVENMIRNALEATSEGGTVRVRATQDGDEVEVAVSNPGAMPEAVRHQVFQRSFSTKGKGRGLGTWSMKLLGERYLGGHVDFTSSAASGTTFRFALPGVIAAEDDPPSPCVPLALDGLEVLVADDQAVGRLVVRRTLERHGALVREAASGLELLDLFARRPAELVLVDLEMPGLDGIEAARRLRRRPGGPEALLVALSGDGTREARARCRAAGLDGLLEKPLDLDALARLASRGGG